MSLFSGKMTPKNKISGEIKKNDSFTAQIEKKSENFTIEIQEKPKIYGEMVKRNVLSGFVKILYVLRRFLSVNSRIKNSHETKVITTPAIMLESETSFFFSKKALLFKQPATDMKVDHGEKLSVFSQLVSYQRAACVYVKNVFMGCTANIITTVCTLAKYRKAIKLEQISKAEAGTSAIAESRYNRAPVATVAETTTAPAETTTAAAISLTAHSAVAGQAAAAAASVQAAPGTGCAAKMILAWEVAFMAHSGKVLYTYTVNNGKDCPDPVVAGAIAEPTRESTAQWHYKSFLGWSTDPDGDADETSLQNVTGHRVLYPVFEKELRYYDISFYDGDTILATLSVAYGDTPEYTPTKSGYTFVGWTPEIVPVTGAAVYGAVWIMEWLASGTCGDSATWVLTKAGDLIISGTGAMAEYDSWDVVPWYAYITEIKTLTVEKGITSIGTRSIGNCTNLVAVTLPNTVESINRSAFYGCTALANIVLPESVSSLGRTVFYGCTALTTITIPNAVTYIPNLAFQGCTSLASVILPDSITNIDNQAFYGCTALRGVKLPAKLQRIGSYAFHGCNNKYFTTLTIPATVTVIGAYAFYNCASVKTADFGNMWGAWYRCSSETATSGTRIYPSSYTAAGLALQLVNTGTSNWAGYWLKIL